MKKVWCISLVGLFLFLIAVGIGAFKGVTTITNHGYEMLNKAEEMSVEEHKSIYVSGVQMLADNKLYSDYKQVNLVYKDEYYSLNDTNMICNSLKIPYDEFKRIRFTRSETEGQILFDSDSFSTRWEVVDAKTFADMEASRYKPRFLFGDGSDFKYDEFNEIFLSNTRYIEETTSLEKTYAEYVKFELRDSYSYKLQGFYLVPVEVIMEDKRFESIQETLKEN